MKHYEPNGKTTSLLEKAFRAHPLLQDQVPRFETINEKLLQTCRFLCGLTPPGPEQEEMIKKIQEAHFWAKEAITKNELG